MQSSVMHLRHYTDICKNKLDTNSMQKEYLLCNNFLPDEINESVCTILKYLNNDSRTRKEQFQNFINHKCYLFHYPSIDLDNLHETCCTKDSQIILTLCLTYYFVAF